MHPGNVDKKALLAIFIIATGLHVILTFTTRIYPFTDLPNHLAAATIYRHYGEPSNRFLEFFSLDLFGKPNVFHQVFCSLRVF
ncbi:MAG: hypothetical protein KAX38_01465, partial [Candidatus Krumholzibacteria bacterium]|nr:hypothetical protein [Candidatus Krumholzibacteria bacterium]